MKRANTTGMWSRGEGQDNCHKHTNQPGQQSSLYLGTSYVDWGLAWFKGTSAETVPHLMRFVGISTKGHFPRTPFLIVSEAKALLKHQMPTITSHSFKKRHPSFYEICAPQPMKKRCRRRSLSQVALRIDHKV